MTRKISAPAPIFICVAAIGVNLIGAFVAKNFGLPLYLDTGGTIFVAMLSGYVPGIVVGFATNFLASFVSESRMYYCSISILVAIYTTFLARRGVFSDIGKTLVAIPVLAFVATLCIELIEKFLYCAGVVEVFSQIQTGFVSMFLRELADKGLLVLLMFAVVKFLPPNVRKIFRGLGRKQAPLTAEMHHAVYSSKCPKSSLRTKVLLILVLSSLFIAASISSISYRIFEQSATTARIKTSGRLATIAAAEITPAQLDGTARNADVEKKFRMIKESNPDIEILHVCKISDTGSRVVFGDSKILPDEFAAFKELLAGREVAPVLCGDGDERSLAVYKAIYDGGQCVGCVTIVQSMQLISDYGRSFTAKVLALFSGCFLFVFVVGLRFVENNIVLPINTMSYCAQNFAYDSDDYCANNVEQIKRLDIRTGDEIENLYLSLCTTTQNALENFEKLCRTKQRVAEMNELAHTDSLTGLRNKAAYDEKTAELDEKISGGVANFCIAMIDVNFLKRVNDTFGHERGNEYLINAGKLICSVFGAEHVYRIGGDEFVIIIEDEKVSLCKYFVTQFQAEIARKNSNKLLKPWEKISAAIGAAFYEATRDGTADDVFRRADALMYENKVAMKAARI